MRRLGGKNVLLSCMLAFASAFFAEANAQENFGGSPVPPQPLQQLPSQLQSVPSSMPNVLRPAPMPQASRPAPLTYQQVAAMNANASANSATAATASNSISPGQSNGYPYLDAPMYSCPSPMTPAHIGGSYITTPAFAPHEMLYPHTYNAMYPPYYHKVTGGWVWTPFGIRSHERWELQGTQVQVKYRSHMPLFSHNPATSMNHGLWR